MTSKLLKKIVGALGYKLFDKNYIENTRLISRNSSLTIKTLLNFLKINVLITNSDRSNDGENFDELSKFIQNYKINSILVEPIDEHFQTLKMYIQSINVSLKM